MTCTSLCVIWPAGKRLASLLSLCTSIIANLLDGTTNIHLVVPPKPINCIRLLNGSFVYKGEDGVNVAGLNSFPAQENGSTERPSEDDVRRHLKSGLGGTIVNTIYLMRRVIPL